MKKLTPVLSIAALVAPPVAGAKSVAAGVAAVVPAAGIVRRLRPRAAPRPVTQT